MEGYGIGISPGRIGSLVLALPLLASGCGDSAPTAPAPREPPVDSRIGPEGGTLVAAGGNVTLVFPAGALAERSEISVTAATEFPPNPRIVQGTVYRFEPEGLHFRRRVELSVKYDMASVPPGVRPAELRFYRVADGAWMEVAGSRSRQEDLVIGTISDFALYGVLGVPVASLDIGPDSTGVVVRGTVQLAAVPSDATGLPLPDRRITWSSSSHDVATVSPTGLVTGMAVGRATITATSEGVTASALVNVVQPATQLLVQTQPDDAASGAPLGVQPVVALADVSGAEVTADHSTVVTASLASGAGTLEGTTSLRARSGRVTFTDLILSGTVGSYTLAFEAAELPTVTSTPFVLHPGAASPATSVVTVSKNEIGSGRQAVVQLQTRDAQGNALDRGGLVVTFTISGGTSEGNISGTLDHKDGTYSARFTGTTPGSPVTIGATIGQTPVTSELPTIRVLEGVIAGTVRSIGDGAVSRHLVEILDDEVLVATAFTDEAGAFLIKGLAAGNYLVRVQPSPGFSIARGDADPGSVDVIGPDTARLILSVERALWFDDFSRYVDEEAFEAGFANEPGGNRVFVDAALDACMRTLISLDRITPAMRYDWWNREADPTGLDAIGLACAPDDPTASFTLGYGRQWSIPRPAADPGLWVRLVTKEGTPEKGFTYGCEQCAESPGNGSYRFVLDFFENRSDVFGIRMSGPFAMPTLTWVGLDCRVPHPGVGQWHTYVFGFDLAEGKAQVYVDGALQCEAPFGSDPGGIHSLRPGWNMSAGPSQAESRWIREVGLYSGRPSTLPR